MATTQARRRVSKHDLKTDAFTTSVFAAKEWAEENMRLVVMAIGAVVVLGAAGWGFTSYRHSRQEAAQGLFGEAGVEMRSGNNTVAIALLQKLLAEHGGADLAGVACIQKAQLHFQLRAYDDARVAFQKYVDDYGDDPYLTAAAWAGLGAIEEQAGFPENAITNYRNAITADAQGPQTGEYLRRLIRVSVDAGDAEGALTAYETLKSDFPNDTDDLNRSHQLLIERGILEPL